MDKRKNPAGHGTGAYPKLTVGSFEIVGIVIGDEVGQGTEIGGGCHPEVTAEMGR